MRNSSNRFKNYFCLITSKNFIQFNIQRCSNFTIYGIYVTETQCSHHIILISVEKLPTNLIIPPIYVEISMMCMFEITKATIHPAGMFIFLSQNPRLCS